MPANRFYFICGNDDYLVSEKVKSILKECISNPSEADTQLERIDGAVDKVEAAQTAIRKCLSAMNSLGLFSEEKTILLENATFFGDNRTAQSATVQEEVARLTEKIKAGMPLGVTLIITATEIDKRRAFYKACGKAGEVHEFKIPEDKYASDHAAVMERLDRLLEGKQLKMSTAVKESFQQKVGLETRLILNELEKLAVAISPRTTVALDDVANFVSASREAEFFDLADAFADRDLPKTLRILRQLIFQRQNLMGLVINLEKRIRDLIIYREAIDRHWITRKQAGSRDAYTWATLPPEVEQGFSQELDNDPRRMHPVRISILAGQAAGFSRKRLDYCQRQITQAHEQMVSSRVPPELIMEIALVRMLSAAKRPVASTARTAPATSGR